MFYALREPDRAPPRAPLDPDVSRMQPMTEAPSGFSGEPRGVGVEFLVHREPDAVSDVPRPEQLDRSHHEQPHPSSVPHSAETRVFQTHAAASIEAAGAVAIGFFEWSRRDSNPGPL